MRKVTDELAEALKNRNESAPPDWPTTAEVHEALSKLDPEAFAKHLNEREGKPLFGIDTSESPWISNPVNHPPHYNSGKIEVIEFIEDQNLGYHLGNVVKYIARAGKKAPDRLIEDLQKAKWYLTRHLEILESQRAGQAPKRPNDMNPRT